MKTIKHILYILIFVLGFTNCIPSEHFLDNKLEDEVMVIIDKNGGYLNIDDDYYIIEGYFLDDYLICLLEDDDLVGYELNIDGKIYPPGTDLWLNDSKWVLNYGKERKHFNYPSDRTIIFKAIWKE